LREAKAERRLSVEDLRDAYAVPYETAAHRFTNLATRHLDTPVHFMKVHESGTMHKAYENAGVRFPSDPLGPIEWQPVCRHVLVHLARAGLHRGRVLGERGRVVRARAVLPGPRGPRAHDLALPRPGLLPARTRGTPREPRGNTLTSPAVVATMTTIGFIGAGHIGGTLAHLAVAAGYEVVVSNSRGPETLVDLVTELGDSARAGTAQEAAEAGDVAVVTIPLRNYREVPVGPLAGKVVIDTNNYYPQRDGQIAELDSEETTTAELLQAHLPTSKVVKAFNHITSADLGAQGTPPGTAGRRALAIVGDDAEAKSQVAGLIDRLGYDVLDAGPLAEGWRIQRDTPGYIVRLDKAGLERALANAKRYAEVG